MPPRKHRLLFQSYLQDSFEVFSEHSLSVIVYHRGPRDPHVQTRSLLSKEIYCFSFSTMDLDIIVIVIIIYLFI